MLGRRLASNVPNIKGVDIHPEVEKLPHPAARLLGRINHKVGTRCHILTGGGVHFHSTPVLQYGPWGDF